jgi:hypothetical protein
MVVYEDVEINEVNLKESKQAIYSRLAGTKESATIICIWQKLKDRQRSGKKLYR